MNWRVACVVALLTSPVPAHAGERYALIVSGPAGGERFAVLQQTWRETLTTALVDRLGFETGNVAVLDHESQGRTGATRESVQIALADLRRRAGADDLVLMVLLGHGTIDGADAKFNLVGPDLSAMAWKEALDGIAARLIVVNTTEASFPFLEQLSRRGRVVITATDSAMQRYSTMFAEYFVKAITNPANDIDRDGRVSIWEIFEGTSEGVKRYYEQRGQLSTEGALLDDNGDGRGRSAMVAGVDGALARTLFLDAVANNDRRLSPDAAALAVERRLIEGQIDELRLRRPLLTEADYAAQMEVLLVRLARLTRLIQAP